MPTEIFIHWTFQAMRHKFAGKRHRIHRTHIGLDSNTNDFALMGTTLAKIEAVLWRCDFYLDAVMGSAANIYNSGGLQQMRIDLAGSTTGLRVYGRAVSPHEIDLCTAASAEAAENGQLENLRRIKLG